MDCLCQHKGYRLLEEESLYISLSSSHTCFSLLHRFHTGFCILSYSLPLTFSLSLSLHHHISRALSNTPPKTNTRNTQPQLPLWLSPNPATMVLVLAFLQKKKERKNKNPRRPQRRRSFSPCKGRTLHQDWRKGLLSFFLFFKWGGGETKITYKMLLAQGMEIAIFFSF